MFVSGLTSKWKNYYQVSTSSRHIASHLIWICINEVKVNIISILSYLPHKKGREEIIWLYFNQLFVYQWAVVNRGTLKRQLADKVYN